jgi:hypothetical protein
MFHLDKTLRWLDPYFSDGYYKYFLSVGDTGLCNRLFHWEVAYDLNKFNNFEYNILISDIYWPEYELLSLPYTFTTNSNFNGFDKYYIDSLLLYENLKLKTVFDIKNQNSYLATRIDTQLIKNMYNDENFKLNDNHYYCDFGFQTLSSLCNNMFYTNKNRPLKNIKLKYQYIENEIKKILKDCVGIHIRRGNGVSYIEDDLNSFDIYLQDLYKEIKLNFVGSDSSYKFIADEIYFNIIDKILEINPNQKIYISMDLPIDFLNIYKNKYGNNIICAHDILPNILYYLDGENLKIKKEKNYINTVQNIVDLFSLSFSKFIIKSPISTWSLFASYYNNTTNVNATDDIEKIIDLYSKENYK